MNDKSNPSPRLQQKGVQFYKCDVDKSRDISSSQGISAMPTFKVYKGGVCVETVKGLSEAKIRAALDKALVEAEVKGGDDDDDDDGVVKAAE